MRAFAKKVDIALVDHPVARFPVRCAAGVVRYQSGLPFLGLHIHWIAKSARSLHRKDILRLTLRCPCVRGSKFHADGACYERGHTEGSHLENDPIMGHNASHEP